MLEKIKKKLEENGTFRIVFLGDSITSAEYIHPNWREIIEYVLKSELEDNFDSWKVASWGIRCINSGFDGATTRDLLAKLNNAVIGYNSDLVIFVGSSNDCLMGIPKEEHVENIKTIIKKLKDNNLDIVYCTDIASNSLSYDALYEPYVEEIEKSSISQNVTFLNLLKEYKKFPLDKFFTFKSIGNEFAGIKEGELDFIHPNQLGNAYLAKIILEKVFEIKFDPDKYISQNNSGVMFPEY